MPTVATAGRCTNKVALPLVRKFSRWPSVTGRFGMAVVSYQGGQSGRHFSLVVGFYRSDNGITIRVEMADRKRWWRNFQGHSHPVMLEIAGKQHTGNGRATRNEQGQVHVHVDLH